MSIPSHAYARLKIENLEKDENVSLPKRHLIEVLTKLEAMIIHENTETCRSPIRLAKIQRGDVFIAKALGAKPRPWIVLRVAPSGVTALPLSSGGFFANPILSECRLWPESYIGSTIATFTMEEATAEVTRPYTNLAHLADAERDLALSCGMDILPRPRVKNVGEILAKVRATC